MAKLTDKEKTLSSVKLIRSILPQINESFHSVCRQYSFGDLHLSPSIAATDDKVVLVCKERTMDEAMKIVVSFSGGKPNELWNFQSRLGAYVVVNSSTVTKLEAKSCGIALGWVLLRESLWDYATKFHHIPEIHKDLLDDDSHNPRDLYAYAASGRKSITLNGFYLAFSQVGCERRCIDLSFSCVSNNTLSNLRGAIRNAFD